MINVRMRKPSMGRRKIEMKLIEDEDARHVCFSKRRQGIFKKANELSILCGAEVAIVVYSPAGKPYSFGHPSVSSIAGRLLSVGDATPHHHHHRPSTQQQPPPGNADLQELNGRIKDLAAAVEARKKKRRELEDALLAAIADAPPEGLMWEAKKLQELGLQQLCRMMAMLERLQGEARGRANQSLIMADHLLYERVMISNLGFRGWRG